MFEWEFVTKVHLLIHSAVALNLGEKWMYFCFKRLWALQLWKKPILFRSPSSSNEMVNIACVIKAITIIPKYSEMTIVNIYFFNLDAFANFNPFPYLLNQNLCFPNLKITCTREYYKRLERANRQKVILRLLVFLSTNRCCFVIFQFKKMEFKGIKNRQVLFWRCKHKVKERETDKKKGIRQVPFKRAVSIWREIWEGSL